MNLSDYPTPETDKLQKHMGSIGFTHGRDLERRLAACRNTLELVLRRGQGMQRSDQYLNEVLSACRKTLTETAPKCP
jgi:hypothetical protein